MAPANSDSSLRPRVFYSFLGISFVFLLGERMVVVAWARRQHARGHARARLLLVGEPGEAMQEFVAGSKQAINPTVMSTVTERAYVQGSVVVMP